MESSSITDAVRLILRRVVRLLVGTVSYPALQEILKKIYVEEAEKKLLRTGSRPILMCHHEMDVPKGLPMCIRAMVLINTDKSPQEINNVYQRGAVILRDKFASKTSGD